VIGKTSWWLVGLLVGALVAVLAQSDGPAVDTVSPAEVQQAHVAAPALGCFQCHGPHPSTRATDADVAAFETRPHGRGPALLCRDCHAYPEKLEQQVEPNSCVGCHALGGFPLPDAIAALSERLGHPPVFELGLIKEAPRDCALCHQGKLKLAPLLHRLHLMRSELFPQHFQNGCIRCHAFKEDGEVSVESYPLPPSGEE